MDDTGAGALRLLCDPLVVRRDEDSIDVLRGAGSTSIARASRLRPATFWRFLSGMPFDPPRAGMMATTDGRKMVIDRNDVRPGCPVGELPAG